MAASWPRENLYEPHLRRDVDLLAEAKFGEGATEVRFGLPAAVSGGRVEPVDALLHRILHDGPLPRGIVADEQSGDRAGAERDGGDAQAGSS
jgi:hypothetical protein